LSKPIAIGDRQILAVQMNKIEGIFYIWYMSVEDTHSSRVILLDSDGILKFNCIDLDENIFIIVIEAANQDIL
jgi:hypothetical protein